MELTDDIKNPPTQAHVNKPDTEAVLSVCLQSCDNLNTQRTTLGHLRNQTIAGKLEVIIVTPTTDDLDKIKDLLDAFQGYKLVTCPAEAGMSIMRALGIPEDMFTVMFALGRMPGWIANWKEVRDQKSRIYRPRQVYTGATDRTVTPIDQRG